MHLPKIYPSILALLTRKQSNHCVPIVVPKWHGLFQQLKFTAVNVSYVPVSLNASPISESVGLSTKVKMMNLSSIATAIASVYTATETAVEGLAAVAAYIPELMQVAETAYENSTTSGSTKLSAVLATVKAVATQIGIDWTAGLEAAITNLIATAKAAWNAFSSVVKATTPVAA